MPWSRLLSNAQSLQLPAAALARLFSSSPIFRFGRDELPRRGLNSLAQGKAKRRSREAPPWVSGPPPATSPEWAQQGQREHRARLTKRKRRLGDQSQQTSDKYKGCVSTYVQNPDQRQELHRRPDLTAKPTWRRVAELARFINTLAAGLNQEIICSAPRAN